MYGHAKINLLALPGAEYLKVNLQKTGPQDCICIPVKYCCAYPFQARDGSAMAQICVNLNELSEKYIALAKENNKDKENYTPPCLEMKLAYIGDGPSKTEELLKARAEQVLTQQNPSLTGDPLKYAVRDMVNVRLGNVTLIDNRMAAPVADAQAAAPIPVFDGNAPIMPPPGEAPVDDLPF